MTRKKKVVPEEASATVDVEIDVNKEVVQSETDVDALDTEQWHKARMRMLKHPELTFNTGYASRRAMSWCISLPRTQIVSTEVMTTLINLYGSKATA